MRDTVEAFIAAGGNAAFFSGNTSLWQVRIEGGDHDVMVGYKGFFKNDPRWAPTERRRPRRSGPMWWSVGPKIS